MSIVEKAVRHIAANRVGRRHDVLVGRLLNGRSQLIQHLAGRTVDPVPGRALVFAGWPAPAQRAELGPVLKHELKSVPVVVAWALNWSVAWSSRFADRRGEIDRLVALLIRGQTGAKVEGDVGQAEHGTDLRNEAGQAEKKIHQRRGQALRRSRRVGFSWAFTVVIGVQLREDVKCR